MQPVYSVLGVAALLSIGAPSRAQAAPLQSQSMIKSSDNTVADLIAYRFDTGEAITDTWISAKVHYHFIGVQRVIDQLTISSKH